MRKVAKVGLLLIAIVAAVASVTGVALLLGSTTFVFTSSPPSTNVAMSKVECSMNAGNCIFILNNVGSSCELNNISLYSYGDTTVGETIMDKPWGLIETDWFNSTLRAHANSTETILLPGSLESGTVITYQIDLSNGAESMFGETTIR